MSKVNMAAALMLYRDIRGSQMYTRGPCTPWTPPDRKIFVPEVSTLPHLIVFLISTF